MGVVKISVVVQLRDAAIVCFAARTMDEGTASSSAQTKALVMLGATPYFALGSHGAMTGIVVTSADLPKG